MNMYGDKIKQLRKENNLTQAELGEKLFVTSQAVSKWENGLSEPDLNSMKKMCELFNVSMDEFLEIENNRQNDEVKQKSITHDADNFSKQIDISPPKVIEGYCEKCKIPLHAGEYEVVSESKSCGRIKRHIQHVYCKACSQELDEQRKAEETRIQQQRISKEKKLAKTSYIVGGIFALIAFFAFMLAYSKTGEKIWLWISPISAYCILSFVIQLFMPDSVVFDILCFFIKSFKMPGVIFSLSLSGIVSLICIKICFGIISGLLSIFVFLFGLAIAFVVSAFAFPFTTIKYIKKYKKTK